MGMAATRRTKKVQTVGQTDEIEIRVPPSQSERLITVMARKHNNHARVVVAAEPDIFIGDCQPVSLETMEALTR